MKKRAPVPSSPSLASSVDTVLPPSHKEIATRAEMLWREKGCPHSCDDELWLEAERQLYQRSIRRRDGRNEVALANPLSRSNPDSDNVMGNVIEELNGLYPRPTGKTTTSL